MSEDTGADLALDEVAENIEESVKTDAAEQPEQPAAANDVAPAEPEPEPAQSDVPETLTSLVLVRQHRAEELASICGRLGRGEKLDGVVSPAILVPAAKVLEQEVGSFAWGKAALEFLAEATRLAKGQADPTLAGRAKYAAYKPELVEVFRRLVTDGRRRMADLGEPGRPVAAMALGDVIVESDTKLLRDERFDWGDTVSIVWALDLIVLAASEPAVP